MAYLYMQQPMPTNASGVKVHLTAFDPNSNTEDLGYATSDATGNFMLPFTPPVPGVYKLMATFDGSKAYYKSSAETGLYVTAAPSAKPAVTAAPTSNPTQAPTTAPTAVPTAPATIAPTPSPVVIPPTSATPTTTYIAIGVVIIIVLAAAAALILRKRK
jgi:hypothetical protein